MARRKARSRSRIAGALAAAAAALVALSGCELNSSSDDNLVAGKQQFVEKCGACHVLRRADTKGTTGPNLDQAFERARTDGLGSDTIRGVVVAQTLYPAGRMPAGLVDRETAEDIGAYIARVAARPGKDTGALATAVKKAGAGKPAVAKNGVLEIDADPGGQLAFITTAASAPPGRLTFRSENETSIPHNIAIEGQGTDVKGPVVQDGGVSELTVTLQPGVYTFYCSVEGHLEGGMKGELQVKE